MGCVLKTLGWMGRIWGLWGCRSLRRRRSGGMTQRRGACEGKRLRCACGTFRLNASEPLWGNGEEGIEMEGWRREGWNGERGERIGMEGEEGNVV